VVTSYLLKRRSWRRDRVRVVRIGAWAKYAIMT